MRLPSFFTTKKKKNIYFYDKLNKLLNKNSKKNKKLNKNFIYKRKRIIFILKQKNKIFYFKF